MHILRLAHEAVRLKNPPCVRTVPRNGCVSDAILRLQINSWLASASHPLGEQFYSHILHFCPFAEMCSRDFSNPTRQHRYRRKCLAYTLSARLVNTLWSAIECSQGDKREIHFVFSVCLNRYFHILLDRLKQCFLNRHFKLNSLIFIIFCKTNFDNNSYYLSFWRQLAGSHVHK